ncbi:MAG: DUF6079 family protein [Caldilineaceae bacterium]
MKNYAAALDLAATSSGNAKSTYQSKATGFLRSLVQWLQKHISHNFEAIWSGTQPTLSEWAKGHSDLRSFGAFTHETINFRDLVNIIGSICLAPHFADQAPDYPIFSVLITTSNRLQAAQDAFARHWAEPHKTGDSRSGCAGPLDGETIASHHSQYSQMVLGRSMARDRGQVVNRNEIIDDDHGLEYMTPGVARLEPEG